MGIKASHKFARVPPRKCRLVANLVRGRDYHEAQAILHFTPAKSARLIGKLLQSAYHNAMNNEHFSPERCDRLFIAKIWVDEAGAAGIQGKLKRFQPAPHGRAHRILKRASHIHVELEERL
jgi:large subunit ribosomal protein L22